MITFIRTFSRDEVLSWFDLRFVRRFFQTLWRKLIARCFHMHTSQFTCADLTSFFLLRGRVVFWCCEKRTAHLSYFTWAIFVHPSSIYSLSLLSQWCPLRRYFSWKCWFHLPGSLVTPNLTFAFILCVKEVTPSISCGKPILTTLVGILGPLCFLTVNLSL